MRGVKILRETLKITLIMVILVMALGGAACSKKGNPSVDLGTAVVDVVNSATELTVTAYSNNQTVTLGKSDAGFDKVITYFAKSVPEREQPRYQEVGGKQEEVPIPNTINFNLSFKLSDGSSFVFDYGYDKIWFTTKDMIYAGTVDTGMNDVLQQMMKK